MLRVQVSPRRAVYVSITDDTHPNKGGFYCQVYDDETGKFEIDSFTIDKRAIPNSVTDPNERRKKAMVIANQRVKEIL